MRKIIVALFGALLAIAPAAAQDRVLPDARIDGSGNLKYPGGPTLGRWQNNVWIPQAATRPQGNNSTDAASTAFVARATRDLPLTPRMFNETACSGTGDDTATLTALAAAYTSTGRSVLIPDDARCRISSTITFMPPPTLAAPLPKPPPEIKLGRGAVITATAAMGAMFQFGSAASDYSGLVRTGLIQGGVFEGAGLASIGINIPFANNVFIRDARIGNFQVSGLKFGSSASPGMSYEGTFENVTTYRDASLGVAPSGSAAVVYENCGDSHGINSMIGGAKVGVSAPTMYDSKFTAVHVWNFVENGELEAGFDLGGNHRLLGVQVDGPFHYAFRFRAGGNSVIASEVNYTDTTYGGVDNYASVFRLDTGAGVYSSANSWIAPSTARLASEVSGDTSNFRSLGTRYTNVISFFGWRDNALPSLWASIASGALDTTASNYNVASFTKNGVGDYTLNTSVSLGQGPLLCSVSSGGGSRATCDENISVRTAFRRRIVVKDSSGNPVDPLQVSVVAFGLP